MADTVLSVGIDIGTSTTQVVFSNLSVENTSGYFSVPCVSIVDKKVVYKSRIYTTPLKTPSLIDADGVRAIVAEEFRHAGYTPKDTQTGAVIITGETARKDNASLVLERLSGFAGDFVVSTAGPDLESIIAGKGSGARQFSEDYHCRVINVDIGGGTSNLVCFDCGEAVSVGCLDIGGRLIRIEPDFTVAYISESVKKIARWKGIFIEEGKRTDRETLTEIGAAMAEILEQAVGVREQEEILKEVQTPAGSLFIPENDMQAVTVFFSGGVADAIYREQEDIWKYHDIGVVLGQALRRGEIWRKCRVIEPAETIHATVVGAGTYTTTISGSTITYTRNCFPLKNIPVLLLNAREQEACFAGRAEVLTERMRWAVRQNDSEQLAVAMKGKPSPGYVEIKALAGVLCEAANQALSPETPLLIIVECDMAKALGQAVYHAGRGKRDVIALDSVRAGENDYIDMGKPLMGGLVVPVVVKTLVFG